MLRLRYAASGTLDAFYEGPTTAIYRFDRDSGSPWVVRLSPQTRPLDRVEGDAAVLRYLELHGIPAERVVPSYDGALATTIDGHGVLVTTFIAGTRPVRGQDHLRQLGEALGRLHALPDSPGEPFFHRAASALPKEDLALGRRELDRVSGMVPARRRAEYDAIATALDMTDDCEDLPRGPTWSDCQPGNAVCGVDGVIRLIDLAGAGHGPQLPALGWLLYSTVVQTPDEAPHRIDLDDVGAVLAGYQRHRAITSSEATRLADVVRVRPLVVAARELAAEIERDLPAPESGWWRLWPEADGVAVRARSVIHV